MGAKAKAKAKGKKSAKKPAATKKKAAPAKKKPAAKPAAKPAPAPARRRSNAKTIQLPPRDPFVPQSVPVDMVDDDPASLDFDEQPTPPPKKPGAFQRLGSLFARMTGKKGTEPPPTDTTVEIVTGDIVAETSAPPPPQPKKRSKAVS